MRSARKTLLFLLISIPLSCGKGTTLTPQSSGTVLDGAPETSPSLGNAVLTVSEIFPYDFGNTTLGAFIEKEFVVTNTGTSSAVVLNIALPSANGFSLKSDTCSTLNGGSIAPKESCVISIRFAPTALGAANSEFAISYQSNASSLRASYALRGTGLAQPIGNLTSPDLSQGQLLFNYGPQIVGTAIDHIFLLTNNGSAPLSGLALGPVAGDFGFKVVTSIPNSVPCGTVLSAGASCGFVITFTPSVAAGVTQAAADSTTLLYSDGVSQRVVQLNLAGLAVKPASLSMSGVAPLNFVNVLSNSQPPVPLTCITVANSGGITATGMSLQMLTAPFALQLAATATCSVPVCGASLAPGASCGYPVSFAPTAAGSFQNLLQLTYSNGLLNQTATATLQGTAIQPQMNFTRLPDGFVKYLDCVSIQVNSGLEIQLGCNRNSGNSTNSIPVVISPLPVCSTVRLNIYSDQSVVRGPPLTQILTTNNPGNLGRIQITKNGVGDFTVSVDDNGDGNGDDLHFQMVGVTVPGGTTKFPFTIQNSGIACP